jgi:hypothetical protein
VPRWCIENNIIGVFLFCIVKPHLTQFGTRIQTDVSYGSKRTGKFTKKDAGGWNFPSYRTSKNKNHTQNVTLV